jgi:hypothetical protein
MANINGDAVKRTTLTANTEEIVEFTNHVQNVALFSGGGTVYVKFNSTITGTDDMGAVYIEDGGCFESYKRAAISTMHLYSESAATVQWDTP